MSQFYLVVRRTWFEDHDGYENDGRPEGGTLVAGFATRAEAEAHRAALQAQVRTEVAAPLRLGDGVATLSSLEEDEVCERLRQLGLTPPEGEIVYHDYLVRNWAAWYDAVAGSLSEEHRSALWEMLDRVRCYAVVAVELDTAD